MKIRINRYISMCGYTSRRKADDLISQGVVFVNENAVKEPGLTIDTLKDRVRVGDDELNFENKRYVILNKPKLFLTSLENNQDEKKTIAALIGDIPERLYPVGRLDYDAEGLLILTNDGELAHKLHHPSFEVPKQYLCVLNKKVTSGDIENFSKGAKLDDGFVTPDNIKSSKSTNSDSVVLVTFHEGKNHLVKRFFKHFDFKVIKLKRVGIGPILLGDLKKGSWRDLTHKELSKLFEYLE